jgi:hypothetical protein
MGNENVRFLNELDDQKAVLSLNRTAGLEILHVFVFPKHRAHTQIF